MNLSECSKMIMSKTLITKILLSKKATGALCCSAWSDSDCLNFYCADISSTLLHLHLQSRFSQSSVNHCDDLYEGVGLRGQRWTAVSPPIRLTGAAEDEGASKEPFMFAVSHQESNWKKCSDNRRSFSRNQRVTRSLNTNIKKNK